MMHDPTPRDIYTVSRLNSETRALLEGHFGTLWISGEISNFVRPRSGHMYFSLKDTDCQVRAAMFQGQNRVLDFIPKNGMQVLVRARVSIYPARGDYQLIAEYMEQSGAGALRLAFEQLKRRLQIEGLFAPEHKQAPPAIPARIGIVTSPTGAALQDILRVIERRFPAVIVDIFATQVQGAGAAAEIAAALEKANRVGECELIILARGGGSLEDLWAFNEEPVARAIFQSRLPVITGIGHETDLTIADFVADLRAATPTAAAEQALPDVRELSARLLGLRQAALLAMGRRLADARGALMTLRRRTRHPRDRLRDAAQRADHLQIRLTRAIRNYETAKRGALNGLHGRLLVQVPSARIAAHQERLAALTARLRSAQSARITQLSQRLTANTRSLRATGPEPTLRRGYAILRENPQGPIIDSVTKTQAGATISAQVQDGWIDMTVNSPQSAESDAQANQADIAERTTE